MLINVDCLGDIEVEEIAFSFVENAGTVRHKFGKKEFVDKWVLNARKKYIDSGLLGEAGELYSINVIQIPREEVEKMLNICDYIGTYLKKNNIDLKELG